MKSWHKRDPVTGPTGLAGDEFWLLGGSQPKPDTFELYVSGPFPVAHIDKVIARLVEMERCPQFVWACDRKPDDPKVLEAHLQSGEAFGALD